MSHTWRKKLKKGYRIEFEVLGKEAAWDQLARIKALPGGEKALGDRIGEKQHQGPFTGDVLIAFLPYSRDGQGTLRQSLIQEHSEGAKSWLLRMEDGGGVDYDDYVVRASIIKARGELERYEKMLADAD